jgi:hypothetical protein
MEMTTKNNNFGMVLGLIAIIAVGTFLGIWLGNRLV